jgi:hypothetical protein
MWVTGYNGYRLSRHEQGARMGRVLPRTGRSAPTTFRAMQQGNCQNANLLLADLLVLDGLRFSLIL